MRDPNRNKKVFLALSIILPFTAYCLYYYGVMIKNAPYNFTEFVSLTYKYGMGDSLTNSYESKTGEYRYYNKENVLVKKHVKLNHDDLLYLHHKAVLLGFWDYPSVIGNPHNKLTPHYYLEMKYKRKGKHVTFDLDYTTDQRLHDAAKSMMEEVDKVIVDAENRSN